MEDERRLMEKRRSMDLPFDLQPLPSSSIDDYDMELFHRHYLTNAVAPEVLEENSRTTENKLKTLRFLTLEGTPTVMGMLVIGKDPRYYLPGAYIQFLRIDGTELTDPIRSQKEISGSLPEILRRLDDVLEANNNTSASIVGSPMEIRRSDYPIPALQRLTRNAVLHRNYEGTAAPIRIYWFSDRIEIHSPGGPFGQVNQQNFSSPGVTDYRNPHLAEAMKVLGYVQRFGVGIQIARKELENNGNPPPEFQVEITNILVTVKIRNE